jgi:hypothetical protein
LPLSFATDIPFRPDQLILQDDPAFIPDFFLPGLDLDLSALDISPNLSSIPSSFLSPQSKAASASTQRGDVASALGLIIPTSDTGAGGDLGGFILPEEHRSSVQRSIRLGGLLEGEEEGFNLDPGFTVDADGNLLITGSAEDPQRQDGLGSAAAPTIGEDPVMSDRMREEMTGERGPSQADVSALTIQRIPLLTYSF